MSHFRRMIKSGESVVRKDGEFCSGDTGGKDAGAAKLAADRSLRRAASLQNIADRHAQRGRTCTTGIANRLAATSAWIKAGAGAPRRRQRAQYRRGHYRAAAGRRSGHDDKDDVVAKHLKAARDSAGQAAELTKCMG